MATMLSSECSAVLSGRLPGYEDVNDAVRLRHDPAIRWFGDLERGTLRPGSAQSADG